MGQECIVQTEEASKHNCGLHNKIKCTNMFFELYINEMTCPWRLREDLQQDLEYFETVHCLIQGLEASEAFPPSLPQGGTGKAGWSGTWFKGNCWAGSVWLSISPKSCL